MIYEDAMSKKLFLEQNLKYGDLYAGLILGKNGEPDYHLVLLAGHVCCTWDDAKQFAIDIGGDLPTRREQALLYANLPEEFKKHLYWSGEQHASDPSYAWIQYFGDGLQNYVHKGNEGRARAVRRLPI